jgi:V8-like Glu-specific endopeptidase
MLNLSKDDRKQLRQAIEAAHPKPSSLERFVDEALGINLALISTAGDHQTVIFDLIKESIAKGFIDDLVLELSNDSQNPQIQRFCGMVLRDRLVLNPIDAGLGASPLVVGLADWDLVISAEELQSFLPRQFSFEADVGELQRGLERAKAVCKITFDDRSPDECGTGVLIAPDLVLTNYHVLSREGVTDLNTIAAQMRCEFGYVSSSFGQVAQTKIVRAIGFAPVVMVSEADRLDYALVRIQVEPDFKIDPVSVNLAAKVEERSSLHLLQHPEGERMKVSLSNNGVVKVKEERGLVLYVNPAKGGSSGSPCFDRDWNLVALHHKEMQTSFGSVREGILFKAIYDEISAFL